MRSFKRNDDELRPIDFRRQFTKHAEGSVLVISGETQVICNATIDETVPSFLKGKGQGWVTAEYGMLPARPIQEWVVRLHEESKVAEHKKYKD